MLHGRERECALVGELLVAAREGRSGALVVRGEAGIGKSALLAYAAELAAGMRVLRGTGIETESEFPFAGVHQLLLPVIGYVDAIPPRQRAALLGAFGLGPEVVEDRFLVSLAVLNTLAEAAEGGPLLCLVDDAQWLDGASADALTFAARRVQAEGIVLLFAARDDPGRPFTAPGLPELSLTGLDPPSAGSLLAERTSVALPAEVRDRLVAGTLGNPLALAELATSLSQDQLTGRAPLPDRLAVGTDIEQVFLDRIRRQPPDTQTMLLVAAAEDTGELRVVLRAAQALGVEAGALDSAESAGLVRVDSPVVSFRHPLMRSAVYRGLREAADLARAAEEPRALMLAGAGAMFLGDDPRAIDLFTRAVARARAAGAAAALPILLAPLAALEAWTQPLRHSVSERDRRAAAGRGDRPRPPRRPSAQRARLDRRRAGTHAGLPRRGDRSAVTRDRAPARAACRDRLLGTCRARPRGWAPGPGLRPAGGAGHRRARRGPPSGQRVRRGRPGRGGHAHRPGAGCPCRAGRPAGVGRARRGALGWGAGGPLPRPARHHPHRRGPSLRRRPAPARPRRATLRHRAHRVVVRRGVTAPALPSGRAQVPTRRARDVRTARHSALGRTRPHRVARHRRDRAQARPQHRQPAHPAGAADRPVRRRRSHQPHDRRPPVPQPPHRGLPPDTKCSPSSACPPERS